MKYSKPNKPLLQLNDADKDFIKNFIQLYTTYQNNEYVCDDFEKFVLNTYTISEADMKWLMDLLTCIW